MNNIKCYEAIKPVIDMASERFAPAFRVNEEKNNIFKSYCDALDSISDECGTQSYEISVDEIKMTISIAVECDDIVVKDKKHYFCQLAERAIKVRFSNGEGELLKIEFVFPSIWDKQW